MSALNLLGKKEAFEAISAAIGAKKLPHAVILIGDKGIGKAFFADVICKMLLCSSQNVPCLECNACKKIEKEIHPDIFKIYPAGKSQTIGVDEISTVKKHIFVKPNDADYKIFIIYGAERMNRFAQNALLKMIEEPPEDTFFIFTCQNAQSLLATVRSRVTSFYLTPATSDEIRRELKIRFPEKLEEQIEKAVERSGGNAGLAISLCENEDAAEIFSSASQIALASCDKDRTRLCLELGKLSKKKQEALETVKKLKLIFRDVCALKAGEESLLSGCCEAVSSVSLYLSSKSALEIIDCCDMFLSAVEGNANLALSLTALEISIGKAIKR